MDPLIAALSKTIATVFLALPLSMGGIQEIPMGDLSACFSAKPKLGGECIHRAYGVIEEWPVKMDVWVKMKSGSKMPFYPFEARRLVQMGVGKIIDKPEMETGS